MNSNKKGQNVRFSSTLDDEELNQIYVVIDIYVDVYKVRCFVKTIHSGMTFPITCSVNVSDFKFCDN